MRISDEANQVFEFSTNSVHLDKTVTEGLFMKLGIIGLGGIGAAFAYRLLQAGHEVVGFDNDVECVRDARQMGIDSVEYAPLVAQQARFICMTIPASHMVDVLLQELLPYMRSGDVIVDAGTSFYQDSLRRAHFLAKDEVIFLDCGISGGVQGSEQGFCLMIGGNKKTYILFEPLFKILAAPQSYAYVGPSGAGHYVKMVHDAIEMALLQVYTEGFHLLHKGYFDNLDLVEISRVLNHGSVIRSYILQGLFEVLQEDREQTLNSGSINNSEVEQWMVQEAYQRNIPLVCIEKALQTKLQSSQVWGNYMTNLIARLRDKLNGYF